MTLWIWLGGGLMALGTVIALAPRVRSHAGARPIRSPARPEPANGRRGVGVKHPFRWVAIGVGVVIAMFAAILAANVSTDPRQELNTSRLLGKAAPASR